MGPAELCERAYEHWVDPDFQKCPNCIAGKLCAVHKLMKKSGLVREGVERVEFEKMYFRQRESYRSQNSELDEQNANQQADLKDKYNYAVHQKSWD